MRKRNFKLRIAVVGRDGRTAAIERLLEASPRLAAPVVTLSSGKGSSAVDESVREARRTRPDLVIVGPEEPLADGVVDKLAALGIPCVGPTEKLATLESSKAFTRQLLAEHRIDGNPKFRVFTSADGIREYLVALGNFVVKPDGLTGGKGVKVSGVHLASVDEAVAYCHEMFREKQPRIVVEERLDGEEFSLQSFSDGSTVVHMPAVQDHKRAFEGDEGPNTGGMGSYSCSDFSLPFISADALLEAQQINSKVLAAVQKKVGQPFKGILFGGFMLTGRGIKLLEYNVRFGDPEALNVLSVLETDFVDICEAIVDGTLDRVRVKFAPRATVCKYIVPAGYPLKPAVGERIDMSRVPPETTNLKIYPAAIDRKDDGWYLTGSRSLAFVGIGKDLQEAAEIAEKAASSVGGPVYHRRDIGSTELVQRRIDHMSSVRGSAAFSGGQVLT